MKSKGFKISILMLLVSICACCFVSLNKNTTSVYAATPTTVDSYYLMGEDGTPYMSNVVVGSASGQGEYVLGHENVELTAIAKDNYKLVGWQITYEEQNVTIFEKVEDYATTQKEITLTTASGVSVPAMITVTFANGYIKSSTFNLSRVFEDMIIRPVFDHIYYKVEMTELVDISQAMNSKSLGADTLYYETETVSGGVTTYSNAYIKQSGKYYYYGTVCYSDSLYYTVHKTCESTPKDQKIAYTLGAFRFDDNVNVEYDIAIDTTNIKNSKNIDFKSASIVANETAALTLGSATYGYSIGQDVFGRTTSYALTFSIAASNNYINAIDIDYHNLFVVDLKLLVDGNETHSEHSDLFGDIAVEANEIKSNISIYNFYAITNASNTQFLVKNAADNNTKAFGLNCVTQISKSIESYTYLYYTLNTLDGATNPTRYYSNISQNMEVSVDYLSVGYKIEYVCAEYAQIDDSGNYVLTEWKDGNSMPDETLLRGETISLDETFVDGVENVGYKFMGYATDLNQTISTTLTFTMDSVKPQNTTIYLCYQKIEYNVVLTNYNKISFNSAGKTIYPIKSVQFTLTYNSAVVETLSSSSLTGEVKQLETTARLNSNIAIQTQVNTGFDVLGYSLKDPSVVTSADYIRDLEFTLDVDTIKNYANGNSIIIYVYEDYITYSFTYYTEPKEDNLQDQNEIMAILDVQTTSTNVVKYDRYDNKISDANGNADALVAKIIVNDLRLGDDIVLISTPRTMGEGESEYMYIFNWFTEDDKSTLAYYIDGSSYNYAEKVSKDRVVKVVYSMPSTKVLISIEEDFAGIREFEYSYSIMEEGTPLTPEVGMVNSYIVGVGKDITITVSDLAFGYEFVGYKVSGSNTLVPVTGLTFTYSTEVGVNTLVLQFDRTSYFFSFVQYGGGKDGDFVNFGGEAYSVLDVDNSSVQFEKPLGYYVADVKINNTIDTYSSELSENNNYRFNADIVTYSFNLTREQFVEIVENYSVVNNLGNAEVIVRVDYLVFTYEVGIKYGLTNPKGDSRDDLVKYPTISLNYEHAGKPVSEIKEYVSTNVVFSGVPYGVNARIDVLGGAPLGLSVKGWYYATGDAVTQDDYTHGSNYIQLGTIVENKNIVYMLTYNAYEVNVDYVSNHGNPEVKINEAVVPIGSVQISLYDKFEIKTNALRNNGFKFKAVKYSYPVYTGYTYNVLTWDTDYSSLYIKEGNSYILNTSNVFDISKSYFTKTDTEAVWTNSETFVDDSFELADYSVVGNVINFTIEYDLLQLTISSAVETTADNPMWNLTGRGSGESRVEFQLDNLLIISLSAVGNDGVSRNINYGETVTFYDVVTVNVKMNKTALNAVDRKLYDMSLGLTLSQIQIAGNINGFTKIDTGEYEFSFNVGQYLPASGEEIKIAYVLRIQPKSVKVTTVVKNAAVFYENINMTLNPYMYGFEQGSLESLDAEDLSCNLQFMAKTNVNAAFKTDEYRNNFRLSGVKIYCDNKEIAVEEYAKYGISLDANLIATVRMMYNVDIVYQVQPIITYNGGPNFEKTFICDNTGSGKSQTLSVGESSSNDIQVSSLISPYIRIKYKSTAANSFEVDSVVNAGNYNVLISFAKSATYGWLNQIKITDSINVTVLQKDIYLNYDAASLTQVSKIYDGISAWNPELIYGYLVFVDNGTLTVKYSDILAKNNNDLALEGMEAYITSGGKDNKISQANENKYYNLYLYNFALKPSAYNNNFKLVNSDLIISNYVKIHKRQIQLNGIYVYDKVYDGTTDAQLVSTEGIGIVNKIATDDLVINADKLSVKFENSNIGANKSVLIDAANAIGGKDYNNYYVDEIVVNNLTIYPYSLSAYAEGYGEVILFNARGKTEKDKVNLIPLNATFSVEVIRVDSREYADIYGDISRYLRGNTEFAVGYKITMIVGGRSVPIDKNLYLSIPNLETATGLYFLTGSQTGRIDYDESGNNIIVDLSQMNVEVNTLFLTQRKILLKPWQIVLIILVIVLVVAAVVLTLVIVRKRRHKDYVVHEKI